MRHRLRSAFHLSIGKDQMKGILQFFPRHRWNDDWDPGISESNGFNSPVAIPPLDRLHEPDAQRTVLIVQEVIGHVLNSFLQKLSGEDVARI